MKLEDCYYLGTIRKAHGIQGEVKVYFDVDDITEYTEQESVYVLRNEKLTPVFIDNIRIIASHQAVVRFRGVTDRNEAELLYGSELYLPLEDLPELKDHQFYYHEITGYTVTDEVLGELGPVLRVDEMPAQDLVVMAWQGQEVLIPITYDIILRADHPERRLISRLPEGLLEVYLGGDSED